MKTLKEMLGEARQIIPEQPPAELKKRLDAGEPVVVIDVRDPDEYRDGSIEAANNISRGFLEFRIGSVASGARRASAGSPPQRSCSSGRGGWARPRRSIWRPWASAPWDSWTATSW